MQKVAVLVACVGLVLANPAKLDQVSNGRHRHITQQQRRGNTPQLHNNGFNFQASPQRLNTGFNFQASPQRLNTGFNFQARPASPQRLSTSFNFQARPASPQRLDTGLNYQAPQPLSTCAKGLFHCVDICIPNPWRCDGDKDCSDGSDEVDCPSASTNTNSTVPTTTEPSVECQENEFLCHSGDQCVSKELQCDVYYDCVDGSDEKGCADAYSTTPSPSTPSVECQQSDFRYHSDGQCVREWMQCDGDLDCNDGSDEEDCTALSSSTTPSPSTPSPEEGDDIICSKITENINSNNAIPVNLVPMESSERCKSHLKGLYREQYASEMARRRSQARGQKTEDSIDGLSQVECQQNEFLCHSGDQCVRKDWQCDVRRDCNDGSDEEGCTGLSSSNKTSSTTPSNQTTSSSSREVNQTQGNPGEVEETQGNPGEVEETQGNPGEVQEDAMDKPLDTEDSSLGTTTPSDVKIMSDDDASVRGESRLLYQFRITAGKPVTI